MSTSTLACPQCKEPVAVKHHSGRLNVRAGVRMVIVSSASEIELRCACGGTRCVLAKQQHADVGPGEGEVGWK
jgi:hypothetical protein